MRVHSHRVRVNDRGSEAAAMLSIPHRPESTPPVDMPTTSDMEPDA